jgi:hypothetical protein
MQENDNFSALNLTGRRDIVVKCANEVVESNAGKVDLLPPNNVPNGN